MRSYKYRLHPNASHTGTTHRKRACRNGAGRPRLIRYQGIELNVAAIGGSPPTCWLPSSTVSTLPTSARSTAWLSVSVFKSARSSVDDPSATAPAKLEPANRYPPSASRCRSGDWRRYKLRPDWLAMPTWRCRRYQDPRRSYLRACRRGRFAILAWNRCSS